MKTVKMYYRLLETLNYHTWRVQSIDETDLIVLISDVCNKMIMMNFGAESYVASMPNVYEID